MNTKKKIIKIKPEIKMTNESSRKNATIKKSASHLTTIMSKKSRCKNGTKKYKQLGVGCYTQEEIDNYVLASKINKEKNEKTNKTKTKKETKSKSKKEKIIVVDEMPKEIIVPVIKRIEPKISKKKESNKSHLKIPSEIKIMETKSKRYNEEFIE